MEAVRTNIIGMDNVITAAVENCVKRVMFLSTDNHVTVMWANEIFDPAKPDTFLKSYRQLSRAGSAVDGLARNLLLCFL